MKITWSLPVRGETLGSSRGDVVRAAALIHALRAAGHEVLVVQDSDDPSARARVTAYRKLHRLLPGRLVRVLRDVARVLHSRRHAARVIVAAREQGAQLIVETQVHFAISGAMAVRETGLPLILDDCSPWAEEAQLGAGLPVLARLVFHRQANAAIRLVVPTEQLRRLLYRDGVRAEKLVVIGNGVDLAAYGRGCQERVPRLAGRCVIAFAGSFQPWHRVELLVEAFSRLTDRLPVHLLLIGDGAGRGAALATAVRLGCGRHVTATGALPPEALPRALGACDIGVLPASNAYGQPMKLLEYAAAGLACVAPDLPVIRKVVENERTGLLFPPGDAAALAAALERLVTDTPLRKRLGDAAREDCTRAARWERQAEQLLARR